MWLVTVQSLSLFLSIILAHEGLDVENDMMKPCELSEFYLV